MTLPSAIGFDEVIPVSAQDIRPCSIRTGGRVGDSRVAKGAGSMMVIKLLIKGSIPGGPVG
jgi:hypothetical protein